jgi:hypothetical protein
MAWGFVSRDSIRIGARHVTKTAGSRRRALRAALALGAAATALPVAPAAAQRVRTPERSPMGVTEAEKRVLAVLGDVYRNHRYLNMHAAGVGVTLKKR